MATLLTERPLRLWPVDGAATHRRVTWLELFFDLVFVAAVAQVGSPLAHDYSIHGLSRYAFLLLLIWWAWHGFAMYVTRFEIDDRLQRALTFLQMVAVIFMAANAEDGLDSDSTAGFAAAYAVMRLMLVAQYLRARHVPAARVLARESSRGLTVAAMTWLASTMVAAPSRYVLWALAMVMELILATRGSRHTRALPPDPSHLPERFGLFTLILLGESLVSVMKGIQAQPEWSPAAALSALMGIALIFAVWYGYFEGAEATAERHVRSRPDAWRFALWHHAHLPLYLGLVLTAIGIEHVVIAGGNVPLDPNAARILCGATACLLAALSALSISSASRGHTHARGSRGHRLLSLAPLGLGLAAPMMSAVIIVSTLAALCVLHTRLVLRASRDAI